MRSVIAILDGQTGRELRSVNLVPLLPESEGFSPDFGPARLIARDLDHDGADELVVTLVHNYWPSVTYLLDPERGNVEALFAASGHHLPVGFADVNGDGIDDVILAGPSNRLGWYTGIAAVDPAPILKWPAGASPRGMTTMTPDRVGSEGGVAPLLWYALLPGPGSVAVESIAVDRSARTFAIRKKIGQALTMSLDGFALDGEKGPSAARNLARVEAYRLLREARLARERWKPEDGLPFAEKAVDRARDAGDPVLAEWAERVRMSLLAASGRIGEAEQRARAVLAGSSSRPETCFDIARALHLSGFLPEAVSWYRQGLAHERENWGRAREEFFEGTTLAFLEMGKLAEGLEEVRLMSDVARNPHADALRSLLYWRLGKPGQLPPAFERFHEDAYEVVGLETRLASGEKTDVLEADAAALEPHLSSSHGLMMSFRAELLLRSGRAQEGASLHRAAFEKTLAEARSDLFSRVLLPLVAARYGQVARASGDVDEARRALALTGVALRRPGKS